MRLTRPELIAQVRALLGDTAPAHVVDPRNLLVAGSSVSAQRFTDAQILGALQRAQEDCARYLGLTFTVGYLTNEAHESIPDAAPGGVAYTRQPASFVIPSDVLSLEWVRLADV